MFVQFNGNPCGRNTGDCVVRAISIVTGMPWEKVYAGLCVEGFAKCTWGNSNDVWADYLLHLGFTQHKVQGKSKYTIADFAEEHKTGEYVVGTGNHAVAVVDGNIIDSWDSSREIPAYYFARKDDAE